MQIGKEKNKQLMVNNSTKVNIMKHHLSLQTIEHKKDHMEFLAWDRYNNVTGLNPLIRYPHSPSNNWISNINNNTDINKKIN